MSTTVTGPDGVDLEFPDGMSRDAMRAAMLKRYPAPAKTAPAKPTAQPRTFMGDLNEAALKANQHAQQLPGLGGQALAAVDMAGGAIHALGGLGGRVADNMGVKPQGNADTVAHVGPNGLMTWSFKGDTTKQFPLMGQDGKQLNYNALDGHKVDLGQFAKNRPADSMRALNEKTGEDVLNLASLALPGPKGARVVSAEAKVANPVVRLANKISGGKLLNPAEQARAILISDITKDGGTPADINRIVSEWEKTGASSPSLLDAVSKLPSGGQHTLARVRGAGMNSNVARNAITPYRKGVEGAVKDNALNLTDSLHPDTRTTQQFITDTEAERSVNASKNYAPLYDTQVPIDENVRAALSDHHGQAAVNKAIDAAVANRDYAKAAELQKLMGGPTAPDMKLADQVFGQGQKTATPPQTISAGALEEVRQALRDQGQAMNIPTAPVYNRRAGAGLSDRAGSLNDTLGTVDAIAPARADYGNKSGSIEAAQLGDSILTAKPNQYLTDTQSILSKARPVGPVGVQNALSDMRTGQQIGAKNALYEGIGRPAQGSQGVLNTISSSPNLTTKLGGTFGKEATGAYQQGLSNEVSRVQNARAIDPNFGSQTGVRGADAEGEGIMNLVEGAANIKSGGVSGILKSALKSLNGGLTLTDAERGALVDLVLSQADARALEAKTKTVTAMPNYLAPAGAGSNAAANYSALQFPLPSAAAGTDQKRHRR